MPKATLQPATTKRQNESDIGFAADGRPLVSQELIERVKASSPSGRKILFSFSLGKDSIAMWLYLREHFDVVPYFLYWVPGLSFVDAALVYFEDYFGQEIIKLPHPLFYQMLRTYSYREPHELATVAAMDLLDYDFAFIDDAIAAWYGLDAPFCAIGMRAADNIDRRNLILQQGSVGVKKRRYYYPVWDWTVDQVSRIIIDNQVKLPLDYKYWGRTLAAFDYQYLKPLREAFPADYERIRQWFPLIDAEFFRYEAMAKWG
jgi:hypothetical protein